MTILRFLLLSQGLAAVFIAGGLFFKYDSLKNRSIGLFVLFFGFEILEFLYSTSDMVFRYPQFFGLFFFPAGFCYGPLVYMHFKSFIGQPDRRFIWHFIPAVLVMLSFSDIYMMEGFQRISYMNAHFFTRMMPYNYIRSVHIMIYAVAVVMFIRKETRTLKQDERIYLFLIGVTYFLSAVTISLLTLFADGWRQFIFYYLIINTLVGFIGYVLHRKPEFLKEIGMKYLSSRLETTEMHEIETKIDQAFIKDKVFLDRNLSIKKLGEVIEASSHKISQTLSIHKKKNFNEVVNGYRVHYAREMLRNEGFDHYKIEAIAYESGFNNKVTFHKAFVKETGVTPAAYRDSRV